MSFICPSLLENALFKAELRLRPLHARSNSQHPLDLWIGNAHDARDVRGVLAFGIGVVIDLAIEEPPIHFPRDIVYCRFPLLDVLENGAHGERGHPSIEMSLEIM